MPTVCIFGERYSSNLGDGVISDCLDYLIHKKFPQIEVRLADLSGKSAFQLDSTIHTTNYVSQYRHSIAAAVPRSVKNIIKPITWRLQRGRDLYRFYYENVRGADLLILGGGQLLMDNGLYFPLKLRTAVDAARDAGVSRIAFFTCGVGERWSNIARLILRPALEGHDVISIVTRDPESTHSLRKHFPGLTTPINSAVDTAVWSAEVYEKCLTDQIDKTIKPIGIGIMAPVHRGLVNDMVNCNSSRLRDFWIGLIKLLISHNQSCELFTNGDISDQAFADEIYNEAMKDPNCKRYLALQSRPNRPWQLVQRIAQYRAIVAHRLHANIIAFSLGVPNIGLIWDSKTTHFAQLTGRLHFFLQPERIEPEMAYTLLSSAILAGIDQQVQDDLKTKSIHALSDLLAYK
jgi:polysaccharide pyruvyl transferase WcaK-like protein